MGSTATVNQTQTPFCFPCRDVDSQQLDSATGRTGPNHSRQYTVDLSWLSSDRLTPPPIRSSSSSSRPPRSPHRGHAHRRSGALSVHDLSGIDLPAAPFASSTSSSPSPNTTTTASVSASSPRNLGPAASLPPPKFPSPSLYSQSKASLSASSLPMMPTDSPASSSVSVGPLSPRPKVSFAEPEKTEKTEKDSDRGVREDPIIIPTLSPSSDIDNRRRSSAELTHPSSEPKRGRHKKVKSWAGSLIRLRHSDKEDSNNNGSRDSSREDNKKDRLREKSPTQIAYDVPDQSQLYSSSYIPVSATVKTTVPPLEPVMVATIDLDEADFATFAANATSDSSVFRVPKRISDTGPNGGSPRAEQSIIEEEEEEDDDEDNCNNDGAIRSPVINLGTTASSSAVSLSSTASASYNRDRGRYSRRSYSSGLYNNGRYSSRPDLKAGGPSSLSNSSPQSARDEIRSTPRTVDSPGPEVYSPAGDTGVSSPEISDTEDLDFKREDGDGIKHGSATTVTEATTVLQPEAAEKHQLEPETAQGLPGDSGVSAGPTAMHTAKTAEPSDASTDAVAAASPRRAADGANTTMTKNEWSEATPRPQSALRAKNRQFRLSLSRIGRKSGTFDFDSQSLRSFSHDQGSIFSTASSNRRSLPGRVWGWMRRLPKDNRAGQP